MAQGIPGDVPPAQCLPGTTPHYERAQSIVATWCERPDGCKHGPYVEWWNAKQMRLRGQYQDGGRIGTWISFALDARRTREIEFWEGDVHGKAKYWYESGHPWKAGKYHRNQEHARWVWFHEGGGKWLDGRFEYGKKNGLWRQYSVSGESLGESSFDNGTGLEVLRFEDGSIQSQVPFVDGKKHGQSVCWHANGRKRYMQKWSADRPDGRWTTWNENGEVVKVEEHSKHGVTAIEETSVGVQTQVFMRRAILGDWKQLKLPTSKLYARDEATEILNAEALQARAMPHAAYVAGEVTEVREASRDEPERLRKFYRDRNGTLMRIETFADGMRSKTTFYRDGEPYRIQRWHPTGNPASEGELRNLNRHGTWTHWHDNGQRSFVGDYTLGRPTGRFARWSRDGVVLGEFEVSGDTGVWTDWHDNGEISEQGMLVDGVEHGPWTYFDSHGRVTKAVQFERGDVVTMDGDDTILT